MFFPGMCAFVIPVCLGISLGNPSRQINQLVVQVKFRAGEEPGIAFWV
jgi:hypothetical protein